MISEELYEYAKKRVSKRRKFYSHVIMWLVMSVFFILINLATADYFWAIFPILFWGIGVAFHFATDVFTFDNAAGTFENCYSLPFIISCIRSDIGNLGLLH